jgi:hypothetical protein
VGVQRQSDDVVRDSKESTGKFIRPDLGLDEQEAAQINLEAMQIELEQRRRDNITISQGTL